jgi:hypothetical protein
LRTFLPDQKIGIVLLDFRGLLAPPVSKREAGSSEVISVSKGSQFFVGVRVCAFAYYYYFLFTTSSIF